MMIVYPLLFKLYLLHLLPYKKEFMLERLKLVIFLQLKLPIVLGASHMLIFPTLSVRGACTAK